MSLDNGEIIRRLRAISKDDSAEGGLRRLCAKAGICSNCLLPYSPPGCDCACTSDVPAEKEITSC